MQKDSIEALHQYWDSLVQEACLSSLTRVIIVVIIIIIIVFKGLQVKVCPAFYETPSHCYGVSLAMWDHVVLPATWRKWTHPALTPARQAGTQFTYHGGIEGWVDIVDLLLSSVKLG